MSWLRLGHVSHRSWLSSNAHEGARFQGASAHEEPHQDLIVAHQIRRPLDHEQSHDQSQHVDADHLKGDVGFYSDNL